MNNTKFKKGDDLYQAWFDLGSIEYRTWRVSHVTPDRVFFIMVNAATWVKRSKKHGDFGWAKNISRWEKHKENKGERSLFTKTKKQALGEAIRLLRDSAQYHGGMDAEYDSTPNNSWSYRRAIAILKKRKDTLK